jgi:hypothetical protein
VAVYASIYGWRWGGNRDDYGRGPCGGQINPWLELLLRAKSVLGSMSAFLIAV